LISHHSVNQAKAGAIEKPVMAQPSLRSDIVELGLHASTAAGDNRAAKLPSMLW
jgi:hypothetical protein